MLLSLADSCCGAVLKWKHGWCLLGHRICRPDAVDSQRGRVRKSSLTVAGDMTRDYLTAAGVFAGIAVVLAATLGWLMFLQSQCEQGAPFLAAYFPCYPP
jgi:hypothetical protein